MKNKKCTFLHTDIIMQPISIDKCKVLQEKLGMKLKDTQNRPERKHWKFLSFTNVSDKKEEMQY